MSPPPVASETAGTAATSPSESPAPSSSAKPCFQKIMCMAGQHFDKTQCTCVAGDAGAP